LQSSRFGEKKLALRQFGSAPIRLLLLGIVLVAGGCTTTVSHPTRTAAQQKADIRRCNAAAERRYKYDAISLTVAAFNCLEAKGYRREGTVPGLRKTRGASAPAGGVTPKRPCTVPCPSGT
jgi:hypothetical protein